MISSLLKPVAKWTKLPPLLKTHAKWFCSVPKDVARLDSKSEDLKADQVLTVDSKTKGDVKEDRKAKDLRTHEVLSKLRSGVPSIKSIKTSLMVNGTLSKTKGSPQAPSRSPTIPTEADEDGKEVGEMLTRLKSGVLYIKSQLRLNGLIVSRCSGTGFLLSKRKAATAAHVVSELFCFDNQGIRGSKFVTYTVRAKLPGGKFHLVKVTAVDTVHDTACLSLPDGMVTDTDQNSISQLSHSDGLMLGERLFFFGSAPLQWSLKSAFFSAIRTAKELCANNMEDALNDSARSFPGDLFIEVDGVSESGVSGGPLATEKGSISGIVVAGVGGTAIASPVRYLKELLLWELEQSKKGQLVYLYGEFHDNFEGEDEDELEEVGENEEELEDEDELELELVGEDEEEEEEVGEDEKEAHKEK